MRALTGAAADQHDEERDGRPSTEVRVRRWCIALAGACALFAAYISLVPFNFDPAAVRALIQGSKRSFEIGIESRTNFVANIALFVPFGFFGAAAFLVRPRRWAWELRERTGRSFGRPDGPRLVSFFATSIAVSLVIELAQALLPSRTPSLPDIAAQTVGSGLGVAAWTLLRRDVRRLAEQLATGSRRRALELALLTYAAARALLLVLPLDVSVSLGTLARKFRAGRIILDPRRSFALQPDVLQAVIVDAVLAIPVGVLAALVATRGTRRSAGPALLLGTAYLVVLELAQVLVRSRTADVGDIITGAFGVGAGVWLARWLAPTEAVPRRQGRAAAAAAVAVLLVAYVAYNWSPFDFRMSSAAIRERLPLLLQPPFLSYYVNSEAQAVRDALVKLLMTLPVGMFAHLVLPASVAAHRRMATGLFLALCAIFFAGVELGQLAIPSRYPDNTDVLLAMAGVSAGLGLARRAVTP